MIADCKKWLLTGFLAVMLAIVPARTANAYVTMAGYDTGYEEEKTCGDYIYGVLEDGTASVVQYTGTDTIDGHKVTRLDGIGALMVRERLQRPLRSVRSPRSFPKRLRNPKVELVKI